MAEFAKTSEMSVSKCSKRFNNLDLHPINLNVVLRPSKIWVVLVAGLFFLTQNEKVQAEDIEGQLPIQIPG